MLISLSQPRALIDRIAPAYPGRRAPVISPKRNKRTFGIGRSPISHQSPRLRKTICEYFIDLAFERFLDATPSLCRRAEQVQDQASLSPLVMTVPFTHHQ